LIKKFLFTKYITEIMEKRFANQFLYAIDDRLFFLYVLNVLYG